MKKVQKIFVFLNFENLLKKNLDIKHQMSKNFETCPWRYQFTPWLSNLIPPCSTRSVWNTEGLSWSSSMRLWNSEYPQRSSNVLHKNSELVSGDPKCFRRAPYLCCCTPKFAVDLESCFDVRAGHRKGLRRYSRIQRTNRLTLNPPRTSCPNIS